MPRVNETITLESFINRPYLTFIFIPQAFTEQYILLQTKMNERPRIPAMAAPSRPRGPIASAVTNEARSNLFRGQMMRRPAAGNHTSTASIADRVRLESEARSDVSEIVVRNQNGEIQLEDPSPLILEDLDDIVLDDGQEDESKMTILPEPK